MPEITLEFSADHAARVVAAVCGNAGYQAEIETGDEGETEPNPQTPVQFCKAQVMRFLRDHVRAWERTELRAAADADAEALGEVEIT